MSPLWVLRLVTCLALEPPAGTVRVATITYAGGSPARYGCTNDLCAFDVIVRAAKTAGASVAVTAEYAAPQKDAEPRVAIGRAPAASVAPVQTHFAKLADGLDMWLAVNVETEDARRVSFNSLVVFDPGGTLVARHDKVELFEGERDAHSAGTAMTTVESPFGRIGLMICADLYAEPSLHRALVDEGDVSIVFVSAAWTVPAATRWQAAFAHDWGVHVVAANASWARGRGGGIFDAKGRDIARPGPLPHILLADVPTAPVWLSAGSNAAR